MTAVTKWEPWGREWLDRYYAGTHNELQEHERVDDWSKARMLHSRKPPQKRPGAVDVDDAQSDEKSAEAPPAASSIKRSGNRRRGKKEDAAFSTYFKAEPDCKLDDYYSLLGLRKRGVHANEADIKKAYKKVSIMFHPDRVQNKGGDVEKANTRYKAIQKANDTLTDPWARKLWESGRSFNDKIPTDSDGTGTPDEFFDCYNEAFERWSYWSSEKDCPDLGKSDTPDDDVEEFYDFWYNFKSWRDFNYLGEHNLEDAETRDEKRWMAQQNAKEVKVKAAKKDEKKKIRRMVDNAHKNDPRVHRIAERRRQEKEAKKIERKEARRRKKEEENRANREALEREEAERKATEAAEEARRKTAEQQQRKLRKLRSQIRKLCASEEYENIDPNDVDLLCTHGKHEDLKPLVKAMKKKRKALFGAIPADVLSLLESSVAAAKSVQEERNATKAAELKRLEELEAAKKAAKAARLDWSTVEMGLLSKAVSRFPGGTLERWDKIRKFLDKESNGGCVRENEEIIQKVKSLSKKVKSRAKRDRNKKKKSKSPTPDPNAWSETQQKSLETALKMCRQVPPDQRWDRIADLVPGKDRKDCIERFKEIRAQLLKSKKKT